MIARLERWILACLMWAVASFPRVYQRVYDAAIVFAVDVIAALEEHERMAACPTCRRTWLEHRCPKDAEALATALSGHRCDTCSVLLPVDALKTHDGRWACSAHKVKS